MLNLPLGDMLALRIVGGDVYRSGWINLTAVNVPDAAAALLNELTGTVAQLVYNAPVESDIPRANDERNRADARAAVPAERRSVDQRCS